MTQGTNPSEHGQPGATAAQPPGCPVYPDKCGPVCIGQV